MSIQISVRASGLNLVGVLKAEALPALIKLIQENRDDSIPTGPSATGSGSAPGGAGSPRPETTVLVSDPASADVRQAVMNSGAAELLNRMKWDSYSEKILLLGAWHEARGGTVPWKSSDMVEVFSQAKEKQPTNFPRDISKAIKSGWIHAKTPRTYEVTRTGWNRIAAALTEGPA